ARRGAGDALGVVGHCRDGAGHVGAVPAGRIATVVVARIGGIGVAAVAVTGDRAVADEVVAGDDIGVEVAVAGDAGIQHRHDDAAAVGHVPGLVGANAAGGVEVAPLHAVMGVVGGEDGLHQLVHLDVLDVRVGGQLPHQLLGLDAVELAVAANHFAAHRQATQVTHLQRPGADVANAAGTGTLPLDHLLGADGRTLEGAPQGRGVARFRRVVAELDDEAVVAFTVAQAIEVNLGGGRGGTSEDHGGGN